MLPRSETIQTGRDSASAMRYAVACQIPAERIEGGMRHQDQLGIRMLREALSPAR